MKNINTLTLLALLLGCFFGWVGSVWAFKFAEVTGLLFMRLLKLLSLPMIFLAIVSTITKMNSLYEAGILLRKIFKYTLLTTIIASSVGLGLFIALKPRAALVSNVDIPPQSPYSTFLMDLIPENIISPFLENNVLSIAIIASVFSFAVLKLPKSQGTLLNNIFTALFESLLLITTKIMLLIPLGVFAFSLQFVNSMKYEEGQLSPIIIYGACVIGANLIQGLIILPALLKLKGLSPVKVIKAMSPAVVMAFFSKSSNATLPLSLKCAKHNLKISEKTANFSLPICSIINMNGCAAFIIITFLFVCVSHGIQFSIAQMIPWIFLSSIAAIGNAGVPMGCFFLTSAFLINMHVPVSLMGVILPLYTIIDMVETGLNVWSDCCITHIVDIELRNESFASPVPSIAQ